MVGYFKDQGVKIPSKTNPAEFMIDVVSGSASKGRDWAQVWLDSAQRHERMHELDDLNKEATEGGDLLPEEDHEFASPFSTQVSLVCERAFVQVSHTNPRLLISPALARYRIHLQ
jgi:ATP-binding cassette subfamily G (WHITE) protein 2 (SNQ2)